MATAEAEMRALAGLDAGTLRLGGFASACATVLPRAISLFADRHPRVEVGLCEAEPAAAVRMLRAGDIDLAVTYAFDREELAPDSGLDAVLLARDPFLVALPQGHRLADRNTLRLGDLSGERWLGAPASAESPGYREFVLRVCRNAGFEPQIAFEPGDLWTGRGIVAAGLAVGLMPQLAFTVPHPGVVVTRLGESSPSRRILALQARDRRLPGVPPMLECLSDAFASHLPNE